MLNFSLLKELSEVCGVPGREERVRQIIIREIANLTDSWSVDSLGNLVALKKGKSSEKRVLVAAHTDEIGFMVKQIDDNGFVFFQPLGGFDPKTLVAQRVIAQGKRDVIGVIACKPIHLMSPKDREKPLDIADLYIDFGMKGEQVREFLAIGDPISRERDCIELGNCVCGKSLDNRVSVFVLIEALRAMQTPAFDFYAAFTVQEEVGLRGAQVVAHTIDPHFSFGLDTTIAFDTPESSFSNKVTELGKGVAIKLMDSGTITDYRMVRYLKEVAGRHQILWQPEILPAGGTDTAALQRYGKHGSIAGCISIPTRHIHTVVETIHKTDLEASIQLLVRSAEELDQFNPQW